MAILIIIVLIVAAVILFLVELFVIPGISIAGILAGACMIYANYYAFAYLGTTADLSCFPMVWLWVRAWKYQLRWSSSDNNP